MSEARYAATVTYETGQRANDTLRVSIHDADWEVDLDELIDNPARELYYAGYPSPATSVEEATRQTWAGFFAWLGEELLTPMEAAALTGIADNTWRWRAAQGKVPGAVLKGKTWLLPRSVVMAPEPPRQTE